MDEPEASQTAMPAEPASAAPAGQTATQQPPAIDIQVLADKVYALMLAELQHAIMRGGPPPDARRDR